MLQLRSHGFWTVCKIKKIQMLWKMCCRELASTWFLTNPLKYSHTKNCTVFALVWKCTDYMKSEKLSKNQDYFLAIVLWKHSACFNISHWCDDPFIMNFFWFLHLAKISSALNNPITTIIAKIFNLNLLKKVPVFFSYDSLV